MELPTADALPISRALFTNFTSKVLFSLNSFI